MAVLGSMGHAACPRFPSPQTPDQIWQNDRDLDDCIRNIIVVSTAGFKCIDSPTFCLDETNNQILADNGSASHPSFSFGSSTGTGMYRGSTSVLDFSVNGTRILELDALAVNFLAKASPNSDLGFSLGDSSHRWSVVNTTFVYSPGGAQIQATNTNDNACVTCLGYSTATYQSVQINYPSAGQYGDGGSLSLDAGDWKLTACEAAFANAATFTRFQVGISSNTGNNSSNLNQADSLLDLALPVNGVRASGNCISDFRVKQTGTVVWYVKVYSDYSVGTPQYTARLSATRAH